MSNLPQDYFRRLECRTFNSTKPPQPGAQRIGFEWFAWADQDALSRAINDGMFNPPDDRADCSECDDKDGEISTLEADVQELEDRVKELEKELEEAKKK